MEDIDATPPSYRRPDTALLLERRAAAARRASAAGTILGDRVARIAAGKLAMMGMIVVALLAIRTFFVCLPWGCGNAPALATAALGMVWVFVPAAYAAVRFVATRRVAALIAAACIASDRDVPNCRVESLGCIIARAADALEQPSIAWQLVGATFLLPPSLHLVGARLIAIITGATP